MSTARIAASLLACDLAHVAAELTDVVAAGADLIHFDVMDGHFVPNLTFGPALCRTVRSLTALPLDVHLMVTDPDRLLGPFAAAGANRVAVHVETVPHLNRTLAAIRELGMTPGVALNPATAAFLLDDAWPFLDFVLIMTVNPGFGGQRLIPEAIAKLERIRAERDRRRSEAELVVDGGVEAANAATLRNAGADILVAGSAVFGARDRRAAVATLRGVEDA